MPEAQPTFPWTYPSMPKAQPGTPWTHPGIHKAQPTFPWTHHPHAWLTARPFLLVYPGAPFLAFHSLPAAHYSSYHYCLTAGAPPAAPWSTTCCSPQPHNTPHTTHSPSWPPHLATARWQRSWPRQAPPEAQIGFAGYGGELRLCRTAWAHLHVHLCTCARAHVPLHMNLGVLIKTHFCARACALLLACAI